MHKKILKITIFFLLLGWITIQAIYFFAWMNPTLAINNAKSYYFYDLNENLITGTDEWIRYDEVDEDIIHATVAIEDRHFFTHRGFDYPRILKALFHNFQSKSNNEGASTITQQYAKNLYLDFEKTWKRKLEEAWLTTRLETHYSKEEILEGYLNTINYGGVFGIANASKYYFNKNASDLTLAEASMLAGIPNYPSEYSPFVNIEKAKNRQEVVLNSMVRDGYISEEEKQIAFEEELVYATQEERQPFSTLMYYQDAVMEELKNIASIPASLLTTGGLKVYTNLDKSAQEAIENAISKYDTNEIENAVVMMEPNTGKVLGLAGGKDYSKSQFNRAMSEMRSVGSTIKPFLYYAALENNFTSSTTFTSEKTTFVVADNQTYSPTNSGSNYGNKEISLATAIAYSDNIFAVKTHLFLGTDTLVNMMKRVGVDTPLDSIPSLALGSQPISLLDMTGAYATLASEGYKIKPYFIEKVEDINGTILYEHKDTKEQVLNKSYTFILSELLANTTNPNFIDYSYPTAYNIAYKLTKKYAIKTGTTDYDHFIFGYNKDVVIGCWSGYDDNRPLEGNDAYYNKQIWADIIEEYLKDKPDHWYDMPNNVVGVLADSISGKIATEENRHNTILYYIKGSEPSRNYNYDDAIVTIKEEE